MEYKCLECKTFNLPCEAERTGGGIYMMPTIYELEYKCSKCGAEYIVTLKVEDARLTKEGD